VVSNFRGAFTAVVAEMAEPGVADADRRTAVAEILADFSEKSVVTVDRSALLPGAPPAEIPVTAHTSTSELLNSIYYSLEGTVEPFTYRSDWLLEDANGNR
jgi:hypothetical protein